MINILQNALKCRMCDAFVVSTHPHDFNWCDCPLEGDLGCGVDGGYGYARRVGRKEHCIELSLCYSDSIARIYDKYLIYTAEGYKLFKEASPAEIDLWGKAISYPDFLPIWKQLKQFRFDRPNIMLLGRRGSGKTTIADQLVTDHGYFKVSLANPLKDIVVGQISPLPLDKQVHTHLLQEVGAVFRGYDVDHWCKQLAKTIASSGHTTGIVCDDARFPNEVNFFRNTFKTVKLILKDNIRRARVHGRDGTTIEVQRRLEADVSETSCDAVVPDLTVLNDTADIAKTASSILEEVRSM